MTAMKAMASFPVDFDHGKVILSVLKVGATTGTSNYNKLILYQRYSYGSMSASSTLSTQGTATFGSPPDYAAPNSDGDANLRVTNAPNALVLARRRPHLRDRGLQPASPDHPAGPVRNPRADDAVFDRVFLAAD